MSYDAQMPIKKQTHQTSDANKKYQQVLKSAKKKHWSLAQMCQTLWHFTAAFFAYTGTCQKIWGKKSFSSSSVFQCFASYNHRDT